MLNSMSTIKYVINERPFSILDKITDNPPNMRQVSFKNVQYRHIDVNAFCRRIIDTMMAHIGDKKKYQYVFVKIFDKGEYPCGLWHLDSSLNPVAEYENFLFVTGTCRTEFVMNPMMVSHSNTVMEFHEQVATQNPVVQSLPANTICRYDGSNAHRRPAIINSQENRLLIRLSNTNVKLTKYNEIQ